MTDSPARVLWLMKGLGRGGAERLLSCSVAHVDPARFAVEVAYVLPWKDAFVGDIARDGTPVHCLDDGAGFSWVRRLRRLVRSGDFDLVHTHSPVAAVAARTCLGPRGPALVHTEHNVWPRYRRPTYASNAATYGRNTAVIAVSDGVGESIRRPGWAPWMSLPPVSVIHHGIDERLVRRGSAARAHGRGLLGLTDEDLVIGTVGNLTAKKDQRSLLAAAGMLSRAHPRLRVVLIGTGPLADELHRHAAADGLGDRVLFAGSRDDVQTLLPAFDVFALSSLHEGLSIAVLEAMAAGLPCVLTRVGGLPEAMTDGHEGLFVSPGDPEALATALDKLLHDPDLRAQLGAAGVATAGRFSIAAAMATTQDLYDDALRRTAARRPA